MRLREVFRYELEYSYRSRVTWIYAALVFLLAIWMFLATTDGTPGAYINSPTRLAGNSVLVGTFATMILAAIFGGASVRDFQVGMDPLLFTSPLTRAEYLGGRFLASLAVSAVIYLAIPLGYIAATMFATSFEPVGPFRLGAYLQGYFLISLPNVVLAGAILFTIGAISRQIIPVYLGAIGLIIGTIVALNYAPTITNPFLAALADPSGIGAIQDVNKLWTEVERNTRLLGLAPVILWNRVTWLVIGALIPALLLRRFRFAHPDGDSSRRKPEPGVIDQVIAWSPAVDVPKVTGTFGFRTRMQQTLAVTRTTLEEIAGRRAFAIALLVAMGLALLWGWNVADTIFDATVWPVTHLVATVALSTRNTPIIFLLIAIYAGEMVWKERDVQMAEIADATPLPEGLAVLGRFLAQIVILIAFQCVFLIAGLLIQALQGYYNFELGLYFRILFGIHLVNYIIVAALALTIHVLVNHKYLGHLIVLLTIGATSALPAMGLVRHHLLLYGTDPGWMYSDMNGFGPFLEGFIWFKLYWAAWALLLLVVARLMWIRGREAGLAQRLRLGRTRLMGARIQASGVRRGTSAMAIGPTARVALVAVLLILGLGGFIFYNTNVLNSYRPVPRAGLPQADYERRYKRFEHSPQPTIAAADLRIEIYPDQPAAQLKGSYRLVNTTRTPIDTVYLVVSREVQAKAITFDRASTPAIRDDLVGFRGYALAKPLGPGDSLSMSFEVAFAPRGFTNGRAQTDVVANGTHIDRMWLPFIGYQSAFEHTGTEERAYFKLGPRRVLPSTDDMVARQSRNLVAGEDRVLLTMVIGTAADQTVIGSGVLRKEWSEKGRHYFQYDSDGPTSFGATIYSGKYAVLEDRWTDASGKEVTLGIYHYPEHQYTLADQMRSMKASLAYYTRQFGPYPSDHLKIVEFPRYGGFGVAHRFMIGFSEEVLIGRVKDDQFDMPFYGTAHEVAHQWWGGEVRGAMVKGHGFTSESLANYCAMMVTETTLGVEAARKVYRFQMEQYLSSRASQAREVPLLDVEDQPYINYRKGAIALYHLREVIGADRVNAALRRYLDANRAGIPPYPTSRDLYREFQAETPDSLRYVLRDWFERVTLWEVKTERATVKPGASGEYEVTLDIVAKKLTADGSGTETEVPMDDLVEIGIFGAGNGDGPGPTLYLKPHRITSGKQTLTVTVAAEPARAGIDPDQKLIDRQRDDNLVAVRQRQ